MSVWVESLETRRLLSIDLVGSQVVINGTNGKNVVLITRNKSTPNTKFTVVLDGVEAVFNEADVSSFKISLRDKNDVVTTDSSRGIITLTRFITCGDGNDTVNGSFGKEKVSGGANDDILIGGASRDEMNGDSGNDVVSGGADSDSLDGGEGTDEFVGSDGADSMFGGLGTDSISAGDGDDRIFGDTTSLTASSGTDGDNILGSRGRDQIFCGAGADTVEGGAQADWIYGDGGNDSLSGSGGNDVVTGDFEDVLPTDTVTPPAGSGADIISGGSGNDTLLGQTGDDTMTGGDGSDFFDARDADDVLTDRDNDELLANEAVFVGSANSSDTITLSIFSNGEQVEIPSNAGVLSGGTSIARATSATGAGTATVVFSDIVVRTFKLAEFFRAWGISFDAAHVGRSINGTAGSLSMTVNGQANTKFDGYVINNGDTIVVTFD